MTSSDFHNLGYIFLHDYIKQNKNHIQNSECDSVEYGGRGKIKIYIKELWMNINTEGSVKMELEEKTALSQETLREYVQEEVKVYTSLVDQHANKRGREHRNMWYYYMGRLNTCYQFLEYINHKTEP